MTPSRPDEVVLVESPDSPVPSNEEPPATTRSGGLNPVGTLPSRRFKHSDTVQEPGKVCGSLSSAVAKEFTIFDAEVEAERREAEERAAGCDAATTESVSICKGTSFRFAPRMASVDVHELD